MSLVLLKDFLQKCASHVGAGDDLPPATFRPRQHQQLSAQPLLLQNMTMEFLLFVFVFFLLIMLQMVPAGGTLQWGCRGKKRPSLSHEAATAAAVGGVDSAALLR